MDDQENQQPQQNQAPDVQTQPAQTPVITETEPPTKQYVDPIPVQPDHTLQAPPAPVLISPSKPKRKLLLVGIIIAAVLAVLAGSGVLAYKFWYQNPDKVVGDALLHLMTTKSLSYDGTFDGEKDGLKMVGTFSGSSKDGAGQMTGDVTYKMEGKTFTLGVGGVVDTKGTIYLKVNGLNSLVSAYLGTVPPAAQDTVDQILGKVNDKWIKLSAEDTKSFSKSYAKTQKCLADAGQKLRSDKAVSSEVTDAYKHNKFITVSKELGSESDSLGYRLTTDTAKGRAFIAELKKTKFYTQLHDCDANITLNNTDLDKEEGVTTDLWVDRWSHEITKFTVNGDKDGLKLNAVIKPKFNQAQDIKSPEKWITPEQLQQEITSLTQSLFMSSYNSPLEPTGSGFKPESESLLG